MYLSSMRGGGVCHYRRSADSPIIISIQSSSSSSSSSSTSTSTSSCPHLSAHSSNHKKICYSCDKYFKEKPFLTNEDTRIKEFPETNNMHHLSMMKQHQDHSNTYPQLHHRHASSNGCSNHYNNIIDSTRSTTSSSSSSSLESSFSSSSSSSGEGSHRGGMAHETSCSSLSSLSPTHSTCSLSSVPSVPSLASLADDNDRDCISPSQDDDDSHSIPPTNSDSYSCSLSAPISFVENHFSVDRDGTRISRQKADNDSEWQEMIISPRRPRSPAGLLSKFSFQDLEECVSTMKSANSTLSIQDRTWQGQVFRNCCVGSEMIDWMVKYMRVPWGIKDRSAARIICQGMLQVGLITHITVGSEGRKIECPSSSSRSSPDVFHDAFAFYIFSTPIVRILNQPDSQSVSESNSHTTHSPLASLSDKERALNAALHATALITQLYLKFSSNPLQIKSQCAHEYAQFQSCVRQLSHVSINDMDDNEHKSFFLNVWNCLNMHAIVECGIPTSHSSRVQMQRQCHYMISDHCFSLLDIEYGILRHRLPLHSMRAVDRSVGWPPRIKPRDSRYKFVRNYVDPLINFALCDGTTYSPRLMLFTPDTIEHQLLLSCQYYIKAHVKCEQVQLQPHVIQRSLASPPCSPAISPLHSPHSEPNHDFASNSHSHAHDLSLSPPFSLPPPASSSDRHQSMPVLDTNMTGQHSHSSTNPSSPHILRLRSSGNNTHKPNKPSSDLSSFFSSSSSSIHASLSESNHTHTRHVPQVTSPSVTSMQVLVPPMFAWFRPDFGSSCSRIIQWICKRHPSQDTASSILDFLHANRASLTVSTHQGEAAVFNPKVFQPLSLTNSRSASQRVTTNARIPSSSFDDSYSPIDDTY